MASAPVTNGVYYEEIEPALALSDFIKNFWYYTNTSGDEKAYVILPDGCFDLIAELDERQIKKISLTGIWNKPVEVTIPAGTILFAIRFKILAAEYILKQSIKSFVNDEMGMPRSFWEIDKLSPLTFPEFVNHVSGQILGAIAGIKRIDSRKQKLTQLLDQSAGGLAIDVVADNVFWTGRQINRYFNNWLGIPLKSYCIILKCFSSYKNINAGNLAPIGNFYDQSHFIKMMRHYTGVSPKELHQNKNDRFLQLSVMSRK